MTGKNEKAEGRRQKAGDARRGHRVLFTRCRCRLRASALGFYAAGVDDRDFDHHHSGGDRFAAVSADHSGTREAVLRDDLYKMRSLLDQYAADKGKLPQSLEDLVTESYMREMPEDPITGQTDWTVTTGEDPNSTKGGQGLPTSIVPRPILRPKERRITNGEKEFRISDCEFRIYRSRYRL